MTADAPARRPLYTRLLRLRHLRLGAWQRAVLGEGTLALAALLVLADLVSAWALLVLPVVVAAVVKAHDVVAGVLRPRERRRRRSTRTGAVETAEGD